MVNCPTESFPLELSMKSGAGMFSCFSLFPLHRSWLWWLLMLLACVAKNKSSMFMFFFSVSLLSFYRYFTGASKYGSLIVVLKSCTVSFLHLSMVVYRICSKP